MIRKYLAALLAALRPQPDQTIRWDERLIDDPMAVAYDSAIRDIGEREDPPASNSGMYVEGLRIEAKLPRLMGGEWCAVFCSVHMLRAGLAIKSRGAKKLVHKLASKGRKVRLADLAPGMCGLSLHRRSGGWHVRMWRCEEDEHGLVIACVGGNERNAVRDGRYRAEAYVATAKMLATYPAN